MADYDTYAPVKELETLLPVIKEKEQQGLILPSYAKAVDLINSSKKWALSDKQKLFIGRLILRAKRKHKKGGNIEVKNTVVQQVDVGEVTKQVLQRIAGSEIVPTDLIIKSVIAELDKRRPPKIEIQLKAADGKIKKLKDEPRHKEFAKLLKVASTRVGEFVPGIFLAGESSSGKTTGCRQVAEALGLKWYFNGAISFPHEMLGFIDGAGKYHRTPFRDAYEYGGWYTFDEVDRSDPVALLAVNPHMANGVATFPDKQIKRHKDCVLSATANTWGLGADGNYSGATKLDAAFLSRLPVRISWDIDVELERTIVGNDEWIERIWAARSRARAAGLKVLIDTRAAQAGAALISQGFSSQEAAEMTYLANLKPEQRKQVEGLT